MLSYQAITMQQQADEPVRKKARLTYRGYDHQALLDALAAIKAGTLSFRKAAENYDVPKSTLMDRLHHRIAEDTQSSGRSSILNKPEEEALAKHNNGLHQNRLSSSKTRC